MGKVFYFKAECRGGRGVITKDWAISGLLFIVFVALLCCRLPPKLGEMAKVYRYVIFI